MYTVVDKAAASGASVNRSLRHYFSGAPISCRDRRQAERMKLLKSMFIGVINSTVKLGGPLNGLISL